MALSGSAPLAVSVGDRHAGLLARERQREYLFACAPDAAPETRVSLTMPVRLETWLSRSLHPIFQMNLPEGSLQETIRRAIAPAAGDDDLAILRMCGAHQPGRLRCAPADAPLPEPPSGPAVFLEELLNHPDTHRLFPELLERHALSSCVAGVHPKVLLRAVHNGTPHHYLVKTWERSHPHLALNEQLCMTAAAKAGLPVPEFHLSRDAGLFIVKRFDSTPEGEQLGFEDFCSLQGLGTALKYTGSCEQIAATIRQFVSGDRLMAARQQFFAALLLSVMLRNGDSHLKNFGLLYRGPGETVTLAPVFDLTTTTAYAAEDLPALTLQGKRCWWPRRVLERFAVAHLCLPVGIIRATFEQVSTAVMETRRLLPLVMAEHPGFRPVGKLMIAAWEQGVRELQ
ncbi:type II toxin-antitoxin system HipA family toxin [Trichlorobacter ammonificans]|uniref:Type II toxin-antitoxin system HipA family toxin n=1 Tax=Trichlorobacter ammonificans TaxID=2916410 RepID=A0ABM9DBB0_9BACT|nr:type II toxin-antitoxin system HipA family toxin [Trichlorobacter ammonificans]CAH2031682.1 Type II toxin-antitoxin system HipA family toxin [Trichlorobacter ammonificans]